jgi:hypothetical protein
MPKQSKRITQIEVLLSFEETRNKMTTPREGFHGLTWAIVHVDWCVPCGNGFSYHETGSEWRSWVPTKNIVIS